jgi:hypothetical protein
VTGQPVGPQVNTLRVYGAEPSKEQLAMAQQAFAKFCMTERLSFAPNQTQQGFLPDGSKYRIVVVGNTRIMEVRVDGVDEVYDAQEMAHGVLRDRGWNSPPTPPGYKEFKSVGGVIYEVTQKFSYTATPDITYGPNTYKWFRAYATGLMKKYAQFVAGANAGYSAYFHKKNIPPASTDLGTGVVAFGSGSDKRVYFYSYVGGAIRAIRATVVPAKAIVKGGNVPPEILAAFGGCPIPPSEQQWATLGYTVLNSWHFSAALGWDMDGVVNGYSSNYYGERAGTAFNLPQYTVSDDGKKLYFVARKGIDTSDEYKKVKSRPVTITFSETEVGGTARLSATVQATHYEGVVDYMPKGTKGYIEGVTKGICAIGLFNSTPTYFEIEALAVDNGNGGVEPVETKVNISGGINKSGIVYSMYQWGEPVVTGSFSASITYRKTGTFDTRVEVWGYTYGAVGETWEKVWNASATYKQEFLGQDRFIVVGSDGAIQLSEPVLARFSMQDIDCSASSTTPMPAWATTSYNGPYPPTHHGPFPGVPESATGTVVQSGPKWFEKAEWVLSKPTGEGELGGLYPSYSYSDDEEVRKLAFIGGLLPQYTAVPDSAPGKYKLPPPPITPGSSRIYAGDSNYSVNTMQVLKDFTTDAQLKTIENSSALLSINPIYCVPAKSVPGETIWPRVAFYRFSHIGAGQVICRYTAWNYEKGRSDHREMNYGSLVVGDVNYESHAQAHFVGKT